MKHKKIVLSVAIFFIFVCAAQAQSTSKITAMDVAQKRAQMEAVRTKARAQTEQDNIRIRTEGARPNLQPAPITVPAAAPASNNATVLQRTKPVLKKEKKVQ